MSALESRVLTVLALVHHVQGRLLRSSSLQRGVWDWLTHSVQLRGRVRSEETCARKRGLLVAAVSIGLAPRNVRLEGWMLRVSLELVWHELAPSVAVSTTSVIRHLSLVQLLLESRTAVVSAHGRLTLHGLETWGVFHRAVVSSGDHG